MTPLQRIIASAIGIGLSVTLVLPSQSMADVIVKRITHFDGIMGMGASNSISTEYIEGSKKREENILKFTGSILSKFAGTHTSITIYRVDTGRIITLNTAHHTYTVLPMTASNARATSASPTNAAHSSDQQKEEAGHQNHTRVIRNELTVRATGKHETISGYHCQEYLMKWLVITEDTRTRQRSKSIMTSDIWATPETRKLHVLKVDEAAYGRAYLKRLGLELSPQQQQQFGLGMLGLISGKSQHDLKRAMKKIHGYPISIAVKWQSDARGNDSGQGNSDNGAAALQQAAGKFGGMLSSMFHGHNTKSQPARTGMTTIFSSTTKIVNVDTAAIPKRIFEVPTGYHKVTY